MRCIFFILLFAQLSLLGQKKLLTVFEESKETRTATYAQGIDFYQQLEKRYPQKVKMFQKGLTDSGRPLHLVLLSHNGVFSIEEARRQGKTIVLINNAIHAGEPDGIEASMMFARDVVEGEALKKDFDDILIAIIPFYNIGGVLNRNSHSRANQNGPIEYGFRGNAQNYDLNRDFVKADTRNSMAFAGIFHELDPDILIDTHVSNGADYQHIMTTTHSQKDKLGVTLCEYLDKTVYPYLVKKMEKEKWGLIPYVNAWGSTPDKGYAQFIDHPRYSTGYTALFQTMGFMTETHMLKPFDKRVWSTYDFIKHLVTFMAQNKEEVIRIRQKARKEMIEANELPLTWKVDTARVEKLNFKGYEPVYPISDVTGLKQLRYDRNKPFEREINYYGSYKPDLMIEKPKAYIISQAWYKVIDRLKVNQVEMKRLENDTIIEVEAYYIESFETRKRVYEGHFPHHNVKVRKEVKRVRFYAGDYVIPMGKMSDRYVLETLEPEGTDGFMTWNFFDTVLQQKEHFSPYIFEKEAEDMLAKDIVLKMKFETKRMGDKKFSQNSYSQLDYLYKRSKHYEDVHLRFPVFRLVK